MGMGFGYHSCLILAGANGVSRQSNSIHPIMNTLRRKICLVVHGIGCGWQFHCTLLDVPHGCCNRNEHVAPLLCNIGRWEWATTPADSHPLHLIPIQLWIHSERKSLETRIGLGMDYYSVRCLNTFWYLHRDGRGMNYLSIWHHSTLCHAWLLFTATL